MTSKTSTGSPHLITADNRTAIAMQQQQVGTSYALHSCTDVVKFTREQLDYKLLRLALTDQVVNDEIPTIFKDKFPFFKNSQEPTAKTHHHTNVASTA